MIIAADINYDEASSIPLLGWIGEKIESLSPKLGIIFVDARHTNLAKKKESFALQKSKLISMCPAT